MVINGYLETAETQLEWTYSHLGDRSLVMSAVVFPARINAGGRADPEYKWYHPMD